VEIRTNAEVARIDVSGDSATGITLATGEQIAARAVVSGADPKRTLLGLLDPAHLAPDFVQRVQHIRAHGTLAKVNYAVSALPAFSGLSNRDAGARTSALSGRVRLARDVDGIERAFDAAKYGSVADEPWMELTIPSLGDPSLAPRGQHVVSAYVQYAPYQLRGSESVDSQQSQSRSRLKLSTESGWDVQRDRLADVATRTIERYAPDFASTIVAQEVITPLDLERTYGLTGGHIFHGELALDQLFITRPMLGWARYATPIRNLYLCGSGAHPGTGLNGRTGALASRTIAAHLRRRRSAV
jgi:phytoene dehydrogenase-like protein